MAMKKIDSSVLIGIVVFVVAIVYLIGTVYRGGTFDPSRLTENSAFKVMEFLVVGGTVFLGWQLANKLKGGITSTKDFFSILVLTIILYALFTKVISPLVIQRTTAAVMSMLGMA